MSVREPATTAIHGLTVRADTHGTATERRRCVAFRGRSGPWSLGYRRTPQHDRRMSEIRSPGEPEPRPETEPRPVVPTARDGEEPGAAVSPLHLSPLLPRRQNPWLIVEVDGSSAGHRALV